MGRLPGRLRRVRPAALPDRAAGRLRHGPAGAAVPPGGVAGVRGRRVLPRGDRAPARQARRRVRRCHQDRPRAARRGTPPLGGDRRPRAVLRLAQRPYVLRPGPVRAEPDHRHHVLGVAHRGPRGVRTPPPGRLRDGRRRWREPVPPPARLRRTVPLHDAVHRRPLPQLRQRRRRLRPRRRRRLRPAQAALARPRRRRPHPRRRPGHQHQPRRAVQRLHGAQPPRPGGPAARRPGARRCRGAGRELRRGARHRYGTGRPDRGQGPDQRLRTGHGGPAVLRDRLGEVGDRAPGGRGGHRRAHQGRAPAPAPAARAEPARRGVQPEHRLREDTVLRTARAGPVGDGRRTADRGGLLVRRGRLERPRHRGGVRRAVRHRARAGHGRRPRPALRPVGPHPRAPAPLRRTPGGPPRQRQRCGHRPGRPRLHPPDGARGHDRTPRGGRGLGTGPARRPARPPRRRGHGAGRPPGHRRERPRCLRGAGCRRRPPGTAGRTLGTGREAGPAGRALDRRGTARLARTARAGHTPADRAPDVPVRPGPLLDRGSRPGA